MPGHPIVWRTVAKICPYNELIEETLENSISEALRNTDTTVLHVLLLLTSIDAGPPPPAIDVVVRDGTIRSVPCLNWKHKTMGGLSRSMVGASD